MTQEEYDKIKIGDKFKVRKLGPRDAPIRGRNVYTVVKMEEYLGFNDGEHRTFFDLVNDEGQARFINRYNLIHWERIEPVIDLI